MDDDDDTNIVLIDGGDQDNPPTIGSREIYNEETNTEEGRYNNNYDSWDDRDGDTMIIDSFVSNGDENFVWHAPILHPITNRRTKAQVQLAKRSIHRIHFTKAWAFVLVTNNRPNQT